MQIVKHLLQILIGSLLVLFAWGCYDNKTHEPDVLARVGEHILTQREVEAEIPVGLTDSARAVFAEKYITEWISSQLIYDVARKNLPNTEHLDRMVESYRRELFSYEYRKRLSDERLAAQLPEDSLVAFYENHSAEFQLPRPIIKGLLLKVPSNAPQLSSLRKWVASAAKNGVENIEKYAVKNAIGYDYFFDRWVWLDDIKDNIPCDFSDDKQLLVAGKTFEHTGDDMIYMLYVDSCLKKDDVMPYEFARQRIIEILLNEQRVVFNKSLEKELYEEALQEGRIERF